MTDKDNKTNDRQVAHHEVELDGTEPYGGPDKNHEPLGAEIGNKPNVTQEKKGRDYVWGADPNELNQHPEDETTPIMRNEQTHQPNSNQ